MFSETFVVLNRVNKVYENETAMHDAIFKILILHANWILVVFLFINTVDQVDNTTANAPF